MPYPLHEALEAQERMMQILKDETASGGRYRVAGQDGGADAEMTFSRASPALIIIDHTQVPDAMRGQGVGQGLARHAVEDARDGGWKIVPLCPFFRAQAMRHPDWRDVVNL